jgi:predicted dehydrogenase
MNRKLRMGMVGGGKDAFIGAVHRMAAGLDGKIELVCGCFSSTPEKSKDSGKALLLPDERVYGSYREMMTAEAALPEGERMDFVSIVTPNSTHHPIAMAALEAGFDVVCDKPMTMTLDEAKELEATVERTDLTFCLTHNYTGYPMVKEARERIMRGDLGEIRKIVVEYPQGWLADKLEETGQKQADWRTDPSRAGASCCMGDIGTHAENLAEYMTGLRITELCADLTTFVPGRPLEDDGNVLVRFDNGARGVLYASQISVGEENSLHIRVYGTKAGLEWSQMEPNTLTIKKPDSSREILRTSGGNLGEAAGYNTRLPGGHPEGFVEAFANLYRNFAEVVSAKKEGRAPDALATDFPTVSDGVRGIAFIQTVVESAKSGTKWTTFAS